MIKWLFVYSTMEILLFSLGVNTHTKAKINHDALPHIFKSSLLFSLYEVTGVPSLEVCFQVV